MDIANKALPSSLEAERILLGLILLDNEAYHKIINIIEINDFYSEAHKKIFKSITELINNSSGADLITLKEELSKKNELEAVGGITYLSSLIDGLPALENIEEYASLIKEKSQYRELINIGKSIVEESFNQEESVEDIIDKAENLLFNLRKKTSVSGFEPIKEILKVVWDNIANIADTQQYLTGLASGFKDLDDKTLGFQDGELIIIAGRPSMGKTAFSLNIAQNLAIKHKKTIGIFSLEMPKNLLALRMICSEAKVDLLKLKSNKLNKEEWKKLALALCVLAEARIFINDSPAITISDIKVLSRKLKSEQGLDLLIIDYLQLIRAKGKFENRQQEITFISQSLKEIAKELNIPVLALSQLSRAPEIRKEEHRPMLADLRESGSLEQDADTVIFLYREEQYNKNTNKKGIAEVIIAKQRNGPTGTIQLAFMPEYTRFENYQKEKELEFF